MFLPKTSPPTMPRTDSTLAADAPDVRVVGCDACDHSGRIYEPYDRALNRDSGECPYCDGTGGEVIEVQPIEMDDLPTPDEAERLRERADELDNEATRIDLDECDWSGKAWKLREQAAELRRKAEELGVATQISDAVLANVLDWDDALGLSYRLSPHYANYTEIEHLATAIWRRAQERHQLDKDERS